VKIIVVTSNPHKADEVRAFFSGLVDLRHVSMDIPEYRSDDVGEIARKKAEYAYAALGSPVMVDDTGFFIAALNGFPGPYAAYVLSTLGNDGILKLMDGVRDRHAYFETAVAWADPSGIRVFRGRIDGVIVSPRGNAGFGYDPIFEVEGRTLAERDIDEKNRISHRARALSGMRDWLMAASRADHGQNR